ncbi:MAG: LTA synthase family protein [Bacteriovoracaceae bacterium]
MQFNINFPVWFRLTFIFFTIQFLVRLGFAFEELNLLGLMYGVCWDLWVWLFLSIPIFIISPLIKNKIETALTYVFSFSIVYIGICEIIFWNEFHSRFNFIAVDYLIYTREVVSNLKESYPVGTLITALLSLSAVMTWISSKIKFEKFIVKPKTLITLPILHLFFWFILIPWLNSHEDDFRADQVARNGIVEFIRAFKNNEIDYKAFYPSLPDDEAEKIIHREATLEKANIIPDGVKPNVVMIVVESLGAKFIGPLKGNPEATPFLNKLTDQSIFFENLYATGTRTVRGLEALNLSIPPTPGYAVVKRPDHKSLFSLGNTFLSNGYRPTFLYGGNGFFDNMNSFFSGNGFEVVDELDFEKTEKTFSNAWGVCDEDMFNKAKQIAKKQSKEKNPFLLFMLTTSNHRPFTYPEGKIDIPSGTSRLGAVKYTDYAIGKFLEDVKSEDWFKNTVFVIVADHSTEGRGHYELEMSDFHIPLWIYSPHLIRPQVVKKLGSQIDLLPTLIHLLNLKDNSPFFGKSFFDPNWQEERAFVGNYQYVGYYKDQVLTTLGPNKKIHNFSYDPETREQKSFDKAPFINEAISFYQVASGKLKNGKYKITSK